jgi:hypothetical protein
VLLPDTVLRGAPAAGADGADGADEAAEARAEASAAA